MQLATPVFAEEVARPPVLVVVLQRHQGVEHLQNLAAHRADLRRRDDEDEVVAADVPHEAARAHEALDHVVQDAGENVDDPVAVVITVPVVELLEVIEVGVADRKLLVGLEPAADLPLDLGGAGKPGGRVDRDVALGPHQHGIQPGPLLGRGKQSGDYLVRAGGEPGLDLLRVVGAGQRGDRHDGREGIALESPHQPRPEWSPSTKSRHG